MKTIARYLMSVAVTTVLIGLLMVLLVDAYELERTGTCTHCLLLPTLSLREIPQ